MLPHYFGMTHALITIINRNQITRYRQKKFGKKKRKRKGKKEEKKRSTTITRPIESKGDERDFEWSEPTNGTLPPSARRRAGFTGLLDMVKKTRAFTISGNVL